MRTDSARFGTLTPAGGEPLAGWRPERPVVLVVGAEGPGLSTPLLDAATRRLRIPMAAGVDSVNVATAAAIALHHLASLGATGVPGDAGA